MASEIEKQLSQSLPSSQSMARSMLAIRYPVPGTQVCAPHFKHPWVARTSITKAHAHALTNSHSPSKKLTHPLSDQITIVVALGGPIARVALAHAVLLANTVLNHRVQDFGADTQLPVSSDPYHIQSSDGAFVHIHSNRQDHRHLTYGIMAAAAEGLWDVMIGQHNYHEAHFQIFEAGVGLMGGGRIRGANQ